jgi:hypothetical protein
MNTFTLALTGNKLSAIFPSSIFGTSSVFDISKNITDYSFNGGITNGQYVIILRDSSSGAITIGPPISSGTTYYSNFSSALTVSGGKYGILTVVYDGARYYLSGSAFNQN